jgi:GNAT superfamily N-acetyltransferase
VHRNAITGGLLLLDTARVTHVRAAVPEDALGIAHVHVRSWQAAYQGLISQEYLDSLKPADMARRYNFDRSSPGLPLILVAVEGNSICGFAITSKSRDEDLPNAGELRAIYVDPQQWREGVGRALIAAAREQLRRDGYTDAVVWVLDGNARARRFYESDGWSRDGTGRREIIGNTHVEEVRYRRTVV